MKRGEQNFNHNHIKPKTEFGEWTDQMRKEKNIVPTSLTSLTSLTFSRSHVLTLGILCLTTLLLGQPTVKIEVSADTINPGELVEVTYTIENGEGRFEAPDLRNLSVMSGPNTSSSFMIQNGKKSSSQSYSYILRAEEEGRIVIPEAYFHEKEHDLKIDPVEIVVLIHSKKPLSQHPDNQPSKVTREKKKF